jgi:hypothetical protein
LFFIIDGVFCASAYEDILHSLRPPITIYADDINGDKHLIDTAFTPVSLMSVQ